MPVYTITTLFVASVVTAILALRDSIMLPFVMNEAIPTTITINHENDAMRSYGSNNNNYSNTESVQNDDTTRETKLTHHNNISRTNSSGASSTVYQSNHRHEYQGSYSGTTCYTRRGFPNRTLLQVNSIRQGGFPETQFTHYIQTAVIDRHKIFNRTEICDQAHISIRADKYGAVKAIRSIYPDRTNKGQFNERWKTSFMHVFSEQCNRVLPSIILLGSNVSDYSTPFGVGGTDFTLPRDHKFKCFASSSPGGIFSVFNFLVMRDFATFPRRLKKATPWEGKDPIPVWRGTLWDLDSHAKRAIRKIEKEAPLSTQELAKKFYTPMTVESSKIALKQRIPLVGFSLDHPELLNARGGISRVKLKSRLKKKLANALKIPPNVALDDYLKALFPEDFVPRDRYFSKYQVVLVMGGIGAAFRTSDHLAMGSAVVLQDYPYQEWFVPYMRPFVEYIPLNYNVSNLEETLIWIKENPTKVKEIASNGRLFYERYLSFEKMEEFIYELVYRLAEDRIYKGIYE